MKISKGDGGFLLVDFFVSEVDFFIYLNILLVWLHLVDWGLMSNLDF